MDKKFVVQIVILIILVLVGAFLTRNTDVLNNFLGAPPQTEIVKIGKATLKVEIADTPEKRGKGLSGRENLATDSGMLFLFNNPDIQRFWMKDMRIPLDIIWIRDNKVVDLLNNIAPPKPNTRDQDLTIYQPREAVDKVLEVNGGFINFFNVHLGDTIEVKK